MEGRHVTCIWCGGEEPYSKCAIKCQMDDWLDLLVVEERGVFHIEIDILARSAGTSWSMGKDVRTWWRWDIEEEDMESWWLTQTRPLCLEGCLGYSPPEIWAGQRHIRNDNTCPMCRHEVKTTFHALVRCDKLQQIWELRGNNGDLMGAYSFSSKEWCEWLMMKLQMEDITELLTFC